MDSDASEAQGTQDLALLGFDDLRKLATKHSIEGVSKLSRAELVESLRAFGVDARAGTYVSRLENALLSLTTCIENLSIEIVALKVGQKAEISALHAETEVLKREIGSSEFKKVTPAPDAPVLSVLVAEVSPELDAAAQARNTHSGVNPHSYSAKVVSARPKAHFPSHSPMTQSATSNTGTHTDQALRQTSFHTTSAHPANMSNYAVPIVPNAKLFMLEEFTLVALLPTSQNGAKTSK